MYIEKQISCNGITINYVDEGSGGVIVFLHNGGGFWHIWQKQLEHFSKTHRVIALDWPGFGESDEVSEPLTVELLYSTLLSFVDQLNLDEFNIVGNCIGASAAILFKQRHPQRVTRMVLMNICPGERIIKNKRLRNWVFNSNTNPKKQQHIKRWLQFVFVKTPVKYQFPRILFGKEYHKQDPLVQRYQRKLKEAKHTRMRLNLLFAANSYTLADILDNTNHSNATLLWGQENRVASFSSEASFHQDLLKIPFVVALKNAGHLMMYEDAEEVNEVIGGVFR